MVGRFPGFSLQAFESGQLESASFSKMNIAAHIAFQSFHANCEKYLIPCISIAFGKLKNFLCKRAANL
jgi:hypothetical protein